MNTARDNVVHFFACNLHDLFAHMHSMYRRLFTARGVELQLHCDVDRQLQALVARNDVERAVENLLSNANKFTTEEGEVTLAVRARKIGEDKVEISVEVRDTGKGLEGVDAQKVWEDNYKAQKDAVGLGLGLPGVRAFAEREGGEVWCGQNEVQGIGSVFGFSFVTDLFHGAVSTTFDAAQSSSSDYFQSSEGGLVGVADVVSVLLVDDDPIQLRVNMKRMRMILPNARIDTATDGLKGLKLLSANSYDGVVTDLNMPVINGADMLERALEEGVLPAVRCVLSANGQQQIREMFSTLELKEDEAFDKGDKKCALITCAEKMVKVKKERREVEATRDDSVLNEVVVDVDGGKKSSENTV